MEFLFFLTCHLWQTQMPSMKRWVWIKILDTNSSNLQNFFKTWPQLCHGTYHTGILKQRGCRWEFSFLLPPSKPHKAKFQQTHCNFTLFFHSNEILVFYLKILLSNINKLDTVKLLIVHKSVWSCITGRHATNSFWWEILWEKPPLVLCTHLKLAPNRDTPSTAVSALPLSRHAAETGWLGEQ